VSKIYCRELDKKFASKDEMFFALKANCDKIVAIKKAAIKDSEPVSFILSEEKSEVVKGETVLFKADPTGNTVYPVINTTNWLDSHGDVHLNGIWDTSVQQQQGKIYYAINHELKIGSIISYPGEVEMMVKTMPWSDLGYTKAPGLSTQALIFAAQITDKSCKPAKQAIKAKVPLENSVRMQYMDMQLCVDSNSKGLEQERMNFYKHLPNIANKEDATASGYFWAVSQAKIVKEGSAVLAGSNCMTPILYSDPSNKQSKKETEAPADSSIEVKSDYYYQL
jgi:hypothetical protein